MSIPLSQARIAIVHEWLIEYGGSERVLAAMLKALPQADLYGMVHNQEVFRGTPLEQVPVRTSFIQSLPRAKGAYKWYLLLMPLAVEQLDLRPYDLVISSSHAVAKGALTSANQMHISYTHTPLRYGWELYLDYLEGKGIERGIKSWPVRLALHYMRIWDFSAANRVDAYMTNSDNVARRVNKLYRRPARVIYPPVDIERFRWDSPREDFFVAVSRFAPYKRMDLIVEAFSRMQKPLVVIGGGPEFRRIRRKYGSKNIQLLGYQPDEVVTDHLQRAKAFIFAANEDFGIAPVEAQAAGCTVIAYGKGGALETVIGWPGPDATGVFFNAQTPEALETAVRTFEAHEDEFDPGTSRRNAERFTLKRFEQEFTATVEELWENFQRGKGLE